MLQLHMENYVRLDKISCLYWVYTLYYTVICVVKMLNVIFFSTHNFFFIKIKSLVMSNIFFYQFLGSKCMNLLLSSMA